MSDPTKVVIVFDGVGGSSARRNLFPAYKANRNTSRMTNYSIFSSKDEENESINNQMARLIQYLQCLPVTMICIDGIEADDTIGYLVGKSKEEGREKEGSRRAQRTPSSAQRKSPAIQRPHRYVTPSLVPSGSRCLFVPHARGWRSTSAPSTSHKGVWR